jgi:hypothetical protein
MARGKWKFTPNEIKRAVQAVQRSGLSVSGVRVSDDAIYVQTADTKKEASASPANEWDAA